MIKKKVLILDRDGTINYKTSDYYVYKRDNFKTYDDARQLVSQAHKKGYKIAIATNQRGISKGLYTSNDVMVLHSMFCESINVDVNEIPLFFCPHDIEVCICRKPQPGMILSILKHYSIEPSDALFIGNSKSDYLAACKSDVDFVHVIREESDKFLADIREIVSVNLLTELFPILELQ